MSTRTTAARMPQPPGHLFFRNAPDVGKVTPVQNLMKLARRHGPIFRLALPGRSVVVVSGFRYVDEICSDARFDKRVTGSVAQLRSIGGDGLLTANTAEPNWKKAHNILLSAFSMQSMHTYFPIMNEIADQLVARWEERGPRGIDVAADMTRLTLETIARCGFDYTFDSLSREEQHPFVESMVRCLREGMERAQRLWFEEWLTGGKRRRFEADSRYLFDTVDAVVKQRRAAASAGGTADLLALMLQGVDKVSGEKLDDVNIRHQIITFLIAGHETTSGLLSFALYFLMRNPAVMEKARAEAHAVLGAGRTLTDVAQVSQLRYITQVLRESLRLWPVAPAFARYPRQDTVIGGQYPVTTSDTILILSPILHRDPSVWGEDAERFDPDRWTPEEEKKRPPNGYLPFGVGQRSCIGRFFAMQEALVALATVLHRVDLEGDSSYELKVKETITLKPSGFTLRARRIPSVATAAAAPAVRPASGAAPAAAALAQPSLAQPSPATNGSGNGNGGAHGPSVLVLYGSNMGTSEELARQLAGEGESLGFAVQTAPLDECPAALGGPRALLIVTSSYNGNPPDNAVRFGARLADGGAEAFSGVKYAVFGCGHHDWTSTFQAFPSFIDSRLAALGGVRMLDKGSGDSGADLFGDFRLWRRALWEAVGASLGVATRARPEGARAPLYGVEIVNEQQPNPFVVSFGARRMVVVENRELQLTTPGRPRERSTRHIELALPEGVTYRAGDHLGVIARNNRETVRRVLARFGMDDDTVVRLRMQGKGRAALPVDRAVSVSTLLSEYVELQDVTTQDQISVLTEHAASPADRGQLAALCGDDPASRARYQEEILRPRVSLVDLLEEYPTCALPFGVFLEMLSPLRPRYYSISSSPQKLRNICSITVGVLDEPARSGRGRYRGVCSSFLATKSKGTSVDAFVRDPGSPFRPPRNPRTPLIMVGAGTGVAPFLGFLQERAWLKAQDYSIGPALLFFGCRAAEADFYYRDELEGYRSAGVVELVTAFSRADAARKVYVQDRIQEHADRVWELLQEGGVVYVCGDASRFTPAVRSAIGAVCQQKSGCPDAEREAWLADLTARQRYVADVWASK